MYQFRVRTMKRQCINLESLSSTDIALRGLGILDHTARKCTSHLQPGSLSNCVEKGLLGASPLLLLLFLSKFSLLSSSSCQPNTNRQSWCTNSFWELKLGFLMGQVSRPGPGVAPGSLASLSQHLPFCSWFSVIVDGPTSSPGPHTILEPACQRLCLQFSQARGQALPGFGV